jgi:integral membrane protein (TIGR01906 family)
MERAPWFVALALGISLAVVILLAGPLLLFNPWFVSALQQRHEVAAVLQVPQHELDRVTRELLVDIYTDGDFDARFQGQTAPLLTERERAHMHDVARLVRILGVSAIAAAIVAVLGARRMRGEPRRIGAVMLRTAGVIGAVALALAVTFAVAFEPAFLAFHAVFFPPGTYLFEPGSDLITLFPEGFWFDASLVAGVTVLLSAILCAVAGYRLWRNGPQTPLPA